MKDYDGGMNFQCQQNVKQLSVLEGGNSIFSAFSLEGSEGIFSSTVYMFTWMLIMKKWNVNSKYGESLLYGNFHFTFVAMYFFMAPNLAMIQIDMI